MSLKIKETRALDTQEISEFPQKMTLKNADFSGGEPSKKIRALGT